MTEPAPRRPWLFPVLGAFAIFAITAGVMSYVFLVRWTNVQDALPDDAERIFQAAIVEAGGGAPYIEIADDGIIVVHRDQESDDPAEFRTLRLLVWVPDDQTVLSVEYPRWFVFIKTMSSLNLGTIIAIVSRDWGQMDLSVSFADLKRRGPALLLDHQLANGARIVLWTTAK
jgi:hypothetical protein